MRKHQSMTLILQQQQVEDKTTEKEMQKLQDELLALQNEERNINFRLKRKKQLVVMERKRIDGLKEQLAGDENKFH